MPSRSGIPVENGLDNAFLQMQTLQAQRDRRQSDLDAIRARVAGGQRAEYQWGTLSAARTQQLTDRIWSDPVLTHAALTRGTAYVMQHHFDKVQDRTLLNLSGMVMPLSTYAERTRDRGSSFAFWKDDDARGANLVQVDWALCSFYNLNHPYHSELRTMGSLHERFAAALNILLTRCNTYLNAKNDILRASANEGSHRVNVVRELRTQALALHSLYQDNLKRGKDPSLMVFQQPDPNVAAYTPKGKIKGPA